MTDWTNWEVLALQGDAILTTHSAPAAPGSYDGLPPDLLNRSRGPFCHDSWRGWVCHRRRHHGGRCASGDCRRILAVWRGRKEATP